MSTTNHEALHRQAYGLGEAVVTSILPHVAISRALEIHVANVARTWKESRQYSDKTERQVLIQEKLHATPLMTRRRSRSAANARVARISSRVISGKSRK